MCLRDAFVVISAAPFVASPAFPFVVSPSNHEHHERRPSTQSPPRRTLNPPPPPSQKKTMYAEVTVNCESREFRFDLHANEAMTPDDARAWFDEQVVVLECEPFRPTGKLLGADKVLVVAQAAGPKGLGDATWGKRYAAAATVYAAMSRQLVASNPADQRRRARLKALGPVPTDPSQALQYARSALLLELAEVQNNGALDLDWASLSDPTATLAIYMGLANMPEISAALIAHGRDPATPAVAISQATTPQQSCVFGTLADIASIASGARLAAPVLFIVGEAVDCIPPRIDAVVGAELFDDAPA
jgi:hypothetical protein